MAPPPPPPQLLLLAALAGLLGPSEVRRPAPEKASARDLKVLCQKFVLEGVVRGEGTRSSPLGGLGLGGRGQSPRRGQTPQLFCALNPQVVAEPAEEAGAHCPEGLWPLPPQVSPRVTYTRVSPRQAEDVSFLYHPCAHPWLKLQLAFLAHICMAQPLLVPDSSLTQDRPLVLAAWGVALEMAWVEPAWAAHWLKRRRRRKQKKEKAWFRSDSFSGPYPLVPTPGRGRLCRRGCVQATALAFTLRSWRPPGVEVASRGPRQLFPSGAKRRGLRAALGLQPTPSALRFRSVSPRSMEAKQPMLGPQGARDNAPSVPTGPLLPGGPGSSVSSRLEAQVPKGQSSPGVCACPSQASPAARAAAPPPAARGPTPRTEEAAWAAMALTFLLVLLTLATLCTRLHRNFRRGESIYWEPTVDSQDTVAAVLKRRLQMPPRRVKRSRRRPLLPPTPDSGPDGDSSE
ncbi:tumor protein p53-inducible protein 13 isoform X1 [Neophocaena asiaeorientalis asiaeorientalis]|uniref:Tumor protein p53-inducible protein 13 isoform X1 n=1 Tax=Neophocaena asiaeorientalis asiaeorientalis TaxID=1706337 RepID=A0A341ALT5_NEOAA|nr:tumor protein p53-inducible protein 13 isoform X1 [Neophocaena asiaeorientalis asiaeorientalis]XP_024590849.1 tumor protein p53-inducible protein 13 isoform X1 [Neophocaena asiaeorientalis asiaeorientalis]